MDAADVDLHPMSVNHKRNEYKLPWMVYSNKVLSPHPYYRTVFGTLGARKVSINWTPLWRSQRYWGIDVQTRWSTPTRYSQRTHRVLFHSVSFWLFCFDSPVEIELCILVPFSGKGDSFRRKKSRLAPRLPSFCLESILLTLARAPTAAFEQAFVLSRSRTPKRC